MANQLPPSKVELHEEMDNDVKIIITDQERGWQLGNLSIEDQIDEIGSVITVAEIAEKYRRDPATIRQYIARHSEDMLSRGVIRKSGGTWLMMASEAKRIWRK